jgi:hypothetical protein
VRLPPGLEPRRFSDFEKELLERARTWIPSWGLADGERDFGRALLEVAARFSSEVAERLDQAGGKMARGFLDWLAVRGEAARPARMPVVFKLADTAREPVDAPHPIKMQVDAHGTNVTFETETDVRLVPGRLEIVVGVDPAADAFFLPPQGLSSLDPLEPLPTRWLLKSFAAPGSKVLQFDPGMGLQEGMLVEIAGSQYRISNPKNDLATVDPAVPAGDGFAINVPVTKVETFYPFERARDQQDHALYLGHADILNIEAEATIDVVGAESLGSTAIWEYWGKAKDAPATDADPRWRALTPGAQKSDALVLTKPAGAIEPRMIGVVNSRWIRGRTAHLDAEQPLLAPDEITLRINAPPAIPPEVSPIEVIVNATPSAANEFFPLGREPRMFDAFYVGCAEAFSKPGANVEIAFDLVEPTLSAMAAIDAGGIGHVLTGVDKTGALHLFKIAADGTLSPLRTPVVPEGSRLTSMNFRPVMWMESSNLNVAVAAGDQVWVWTEAWPNASASKWSSLDSPHADTDTQSKVDGLVAINDISNVNVMALVAMRDKRLSMRAAQGGTISNLLTANWNLLSVENPPGTPLDIEAIVQVVHEDPTQRADSLLAIAADITPSDHSLYAVQTTATPILLLVGTASDVTPFAIQRIGSGDLEVIAADNSSPRKLWAKQAASTAVIADIETTHILANAAFHARIESGQFTAYCTAKPATASSGVPDLLAWMPFDPALGTVVFRTPSDPSIGSPQGGLTLFDTFAYMPGDKRGEMLAAKLGGTRFPRNTPAAAFKSALAVQSPAPAMMFGDVIGPTDATGRPTPAIVDPASSINGRVSYSNQRFIPLDPWLDCDTSSASIPLYLRSLGPVFSGVIDSTNVHKLNLDPVFDQSATQSTEWILIADAAGTLTIVQVGTITGPPTARVAAIDQAAAPLSASVSYWRQGASVQGRIFPTLKLGGGNDNWTIDALDHGGIYFPSLDPQRQQVIAAAVDTSLHPQWLAFETRWTNLPTSGSIKFVVDDTLTQWVHLLGDNSSNPTLSWEYWNGTGWWILKIDDDDTNNLKNSGVVKFTVPGDLNQVDWAGKKNDWVRARLTGGDYGEQTVVVITENIGSTSKQTIERSNTGIQPPYALKVSVRYHLGEVPPTFLLTQDSGTLRDQSDANRMPDANIEVFTPLIYALRRLEAMAGAASSTAEACVPACECPSGTASTVPATNFTASTPAPTAAAPGSHADRRALYLGFDSKLSGEPVNILLVVAEERAYDAAAPLNVDALVGDHFVPVVAQDNTRAIGETGVVSMSFSVEPISAELFGRTLSWLRLTPASAAIDWKPALRGAYLNAVWAHAAETMTRELVGSSEGAPELTLQLARPPLLKDSLELRVKEPLGTEERDDLLKNDPNLVKSAVTDLPGDWVLWTQVADPMDHEASARVYSLDEDTGVIRFGDGQHGAIPPIGVDTIVAFRYERTEPATADGVAANFVGARSPLNLVTPVENAEAVIAADQAAGGVAPESGERVLHFGSAKLRHRGRAVTVRDFEDLALERFADVVQARCYIRGGSVRLVAVMRGADPSPSQAQRRELKRVLLAAAPAALAGSIRIERATVRGFRVELTLRVATLDVAGELARHVKQTLRAYFDTDTGGNGRDGWALGASPTEDDIAEALLDEPYLESIVSVALSEIDAAGAEHPWPQTIRTTDLAMLANDGIRIAFEIAEAAA